MENKEIFSPAWLKAWRQAINQSEKFFRSGKHWNESLVIRLDPEPELAKSSDSIGFYLDLHNGKCRELRYATTGDLPHSNTILTTDPATWQELIEKKIDPLFYLLNGKIRIEKGNLLTLTIHKDAARALLQAAYRVSPLTDKKFDASSENSHQPNKNTFIERANFVTTGRGLDMDSFPIKLFQKAKKLGTWDPDDISFEADAKHWRLLNQTEKEAFIHLGSLFMAGEEAVTLDLLPLMKSSVSDDRLEEEIYLTSFLWEEAKHTEFFYRFVNTVIDERVDLSGFHGPAYKKLFYNELPEALLRLDNDAQPANQLKASVAYNVIVEGTLAETGYEAYGRMLQKQNMMPGLLKGIGYLKQDESRHIAFGVYFLNRLISEHPSLMELFEAETTRLLDLAINIIHEIFEPYHPMPFGLDKEWFIGYASGQLQNRVAKITEQQNATK